MIYFIFVLGAIVGSFLNVCIHRFPRGESVVTPPSRCPACGKRLSPVDLLPLVGFVLLKGKCRYCGVKISPRYPLVELITALAFAFSWHFTGGNIPYFLFQAVFIAALIVISFTDFEHLVVPDAASIVGIFAGLSYNFFRSLYAPAGSGLNPFLTSLFGMLLGYALMFTIAKVGKFFYKKDIMGDGDYLIAAFLGAGLGWSGVLLALFLGCFVAASISVVFLILGKVKLGQYIPFGPALATGGIITLFYGDKILWWYFGLWY